MSLRPTLQMSRECGLTLVELLIAMAILSVASLGILGMFPVAHQHLRAGGDLTKATALAQQMVEVLRDERLQTVSRYHNADTRETASFPADDLGGTPPFRGGSSLRRWREEIAGEPFGDGLSQGWGRIGIASLDRGLLAITVTIGWPSSLSERTVQLTTYVGQQ
jgi:prepilin-type N-terminal cleavage/methylation domain-containing protein